MAKTPCGCESNGAAQLHGALQLTDTQVREGLRQFDRVFWPETLPFPPSAPYIASVASRRALRRAFSDGLVGSVSDVLLFCYFSNRGKRT